MTRTSVTTVRVTAIRATTHRLWVPVLAGIPSTTQRRRKRPGAVKTRASVITLTPTVAPANRSALTPQPRSTTYWVAVPEGPGMTLLAAEEDSRAITERKKDSPGISGRYAAASSARMTSAAISSATTVPADIEV